MKNILFLILSVLFTLEIQATSADLPVITTSEFCEIQMPIHPGFLSRGFYVRIDYGIINPRRRGFREYLRSNKGRKLRFSSSAGVLNYMFEQGWELLETYHIEQANASDNCLRMIFKRNIATL